MGKLVQFAGCFGRILMGEDEGLGKKEVGRMAMARTEYQAIYSSYMPASPSSDASNQRVEVQIAASMLKSFLSDHK